MMFLLVEQEHLQSHPLLLVHHNQYQHRWLDTRHILLLLQLLLLLVEHHKRLEHHLRNQLEHRIQSLGWLLLLFLLVLSKD